MFDMFDMFDVACQNQQATQMIPYAPQIACHISRFGDTEFRNMQCDTLLHCTDTVPLFVPLFANRSIAGSCGRNEFHLCALS